jgi:hypothetical protein
LIYHKKYLKVKLLIENVSTYDLKGVYRPQAYITEAGNYCTECQFEFYKTAIEPTKNLITQAVLYAPHGFGENLKSGSLLLLKNGLNLEAKAIVLEIENED